jgi:hypothetical protein
LSSFCCVGPICGSYLGFVNRRAHQGIRSPEDGKRSWAFPASYSKAFHSSTSNELLLPIFSLMSSGITGLYHLAQS